VLNSQSFRPHLEPQHLYPGIYASPSSSPRRDIRKNEIGKKSKVVLGMGQNGGSRNGHRAASFHPIKFEKMQKRAILIWPKRILRFIISLS
jgi:hypothetical protein